VFLFDSDGVPLKPRDAAPPYVNAARAAARDDQTEIFHFDFRMIYACPLRSASGKRYVVVLEAGKAAERFDKARFWFNIGLAMVPAGLVCLGLTLYITRPITRLRETAAQLAAGRLDARTGASGFRRRDELGDLALDFDTMASQIEVLMTAQRRFVADVSHELGGPLTRMHLAIALLRRETPETTESLLRIERETEKLSSLVQQLLLLAGLEAGRVPAENLVPVSIRAVCDSVAEDAAFEASQKDCLIAGGRADCEVFVYPNLLRRAIDNVLRNAIRYAPPGSTIEVRCTVNISAQLVMIEVTDQGPGVPEAMLSDIFKPFFRTSPGRQAATGGAGLGLAIASEAVRLHDGRIRARNRPGKGLQVQIALPLRTDVADA
jgi:two-component system, OmpR family, sensor histidine kinase CpxA